MGVGLRILLACLAVVAMVEGCDLGECPKYWVAQLGYCYRVVGRPASWYDADRLCGAMGGELASIHSEEENDFLYNLWREAVGDCFNWGAWIGLNDIGWEGHFRYTDGSRFIFDRWLPNQPDNDRGDADCVHFWYQDSNSDIIQGWNDLPCNIENPYICKRGTCF